MKHVTYLLPLLALTAACATAPAVAPGIAGLENLQAACPTEPAALTDQDAERYASAFDAAMALPTPEDRVAAVKANVLEPLMARDQELRRCGLYERTRADRILGLAAQYNQIIAQGH